MRVRPGRLFVLGLAALLCGRRAAAVDRWEGGVTNLDSSATTRNTLRHGVVQAGHDLEAPGGVPDEDWMAIRVSPGHSYEARVTSVGNTLWQYITCGCTAATFDRVDSTGAVLSAGMPIGDDTGVGSQITGLTLQWYAAASGTEWVRARGVALGTSNTQYDVEFYDTTYFVPRWNNSSTQVTVFLIQNTTRLTTTVTVYFYDSNGLLLHTEAGSIIGAQGVLVLNTASIPALVGKSGSASIAHVAGNGGLAGKAVALEPGTGFTFDTAMTPMPR